MARKKAVYTCTPELTRRIAELIGQGKTFDDVGIIPGFPGAAQLCQWYQAIDAFTAAIDAAKLVRADAFHKQMIQCADDMQMALDAGKVNRLNARFKMLQYLARIDNPAEFNDTKQADTDRNVFREWLKAHSKEESPKVEGAPKRAMTDE